MKRLYSNIIDLTGFECDDDEEESSPSNLSVRPGADAAISPGKRNELGRSSSMISRTSSDGSYKLSDWWGSATSILPALAASAARMVKSPKAALASVVSSVNTTGSISPKRSSLPASLSPRTDSFSMSTSPTVQASPAPATTGAPAPATAQLETRVLKQPCVLSDEDSPLPTLKAKCPVVEKPVPLKSPAQKYEFSQRYSKPFKNSPPRSGHATVSVSKETASMGSLLKENQPPVIIKQEKFSNDPPPESPQLNDIDKLLATLSDQDAGASSNKTLSVSQPASTVLLEEATEEQLKFIEVQMKRRLHVGEIDALTNELVQLRDKFSFRRLPGLKLIIRYLLNDDETPNKGPFIAILRTILSFGGHWSVQKDLWVELVTLERRLSSNTKSPRAPIDGLGLAILNECISKLVLRSEAYGYSNELKLLQENTTQGLATTSFSASNRFSASVSGGSDLLLALAYLKLSALANRFIKANSKVDENELVLCSSWGNLIRDSIRPGGLSIQAGKNYNF